MNNTHQSVEPEYATAFRSANVAKNFCLFAIFMALALQLAGMFMISFIGVLDPLEATPTATPQETTVVEAARIMQELGGGGTYVITSTMPTSAPATKPAVRAPLTWSDVDAACQAADTGQAVMWRESLTWLMDATKALAPIICVLLVMAILLAVMLSLVGRLGGMAGLTSALFWSLVLLMLLTPWQQLFQGRFAYGAMYSLAELIGRTQTVEPAWGATDVSLVAKSVYYVRFVGLPVLTLLVWLTVLVKFTIGKHQMVLPAPMTYVAAEPPAPGPNDVEAD